MFVMATMYNVFSDNVKNHSFVKLSFPKKIDDEKNIRAPL